jgi:anti-sigma factor RsiW
MTDYETLMMDALDGTITPAARQHLDAYLAAHPDARALFDSMRGIDAELTATHSAIPSATFTANVMRNISGMPIARPVRAQHLAFVAGLNALIGMFVWSGLLVIGGALVTMYLPASARESAEVVLRVISGVVNVLFKSGKAVLSQPFAWAAAALCVAIVGAWIGVLAKVMPPTRQPARK